MASVAVGGCEYKDPYDAGNLEFDWLEVQLNTFRSRNMKVSASLTDVDWITNIQFAMIAGLVDGYDLFQMKQVRY